MTGFAIASYLTFKTDLTAATTSFVCGNAAASNDTAYGIGTSTPLMEMGNRCIINWPTTT